MKRRRIADFAETFDARVNDMPAWARPPFYGLFFVYLYMANKAVFLWPALVIAILAGGIDGVLQGVWVLIAAGLSGFAGGVAYAMVSPATRWLGKAGVFITWWVSLFAYAIVAFSWLGSSDPNSRYYYSLHSKTHLLVTAACAIVFGSVIAAGVTGAFPKMKPKREWIQRKQRVTSRNHETG